MITTNEIRQLANDRTSSWKLVECAMKQGMRSLRQDGWLKVIHGVSTVDEVVRNAKADVNLLLKNK
jgi:type II secretory ATPase GspE/PulE/Tfp pilus assembly ATPase PilB-like protein